jgi:hypothetical protein
MVEATLIVAVAVGAALAHVRQPWIAVAVGAAWGAAALIEYRVSRRPTRAGTREPGSKTEPGSKS